MEARRSLSDKYNNEIRGSLHTASDDTLAEAYISSKSRWTDTQWVFDCETPGATRAQYKISWNVQLTKGGTLCDPEHSDLLSWLKRFAWSLFAAPGDNAHAHQPTSAGPLSVGLRYFALWMVDTGRNRPSELDPEALREYCDDLRTMRLIQDDGTDEVASAPSFTAVYNRVRIPILIWQQRSALRAAGIEPPPREPFDGRSASSLSAEITTDRLGWIRPLPDEVAIKVLNAAHEFLDVPAQDILDLQEQYLTARGDDGYPVVARTLANFQFQCYPRERRPWHPPLKNNGRDRNSTNEIRQLVRDLTCACALVIQGTSGMRISEVCGLPAGIESDTGLPTCVRIEDSPSGLNELFIVRTRLAKTEQSPRSVDWVLGMRPKVRERQAETWPPAVHAITILNRLLAPYRELIDSHDLFISFQNSVGLPKISEAICQINGETLLRGMRDFAARYVNWSSLPDESSRPFERNDLVKYKESQGRIIRSHQWRKFFANFAIRIDPSLLLRTPRILRT
jgi:hypothetical protein